MTCGVHVPLLGGAAFYICTPETIAARHGDILSWNSPELSQNLRGEGPDKDGTVRAECTAEGRVHYTAVMIPHEDFVDVKMTVENLGKDTWRDVFAFNCVNSLPTAPRFKDWKLERTYLSAQGRRFLRFAFPLRQSGPRLHSFRRQLRRHRPGADQRDGLPHVLRQRRPG